MGSGVVGFNLEPDKAVFSDTNPYIIQFYQDIQSKKITSEIVRDYLERESIKLAATPEDKTSYYYEVMGSIMFHLVENLIVFKKL